MSFADLPLVGVALVFFATAMVTSCRRPYPAGRFGILSGGIACLALTLGNACMYYGSVLYGFIPLVQKLSLVL